MKKKTSLAEYHDVILLLFLISILLSFRRRYYKLDKIIMNNLPEELQTVLSDLRKRWRIEGDGILKVEMKTCWFWVRHWWCISWSEIGKYLKGFLPTRWI
jgi:hypothetical protein